MPTREQVEKEQSETHRQLLLAAAALLLLLRRAVRTSPRTSDIHSDADRLYQLLAQAYVAGRAAAALAGAERMATEVEAMATAANLGRLGQRIDLIEEARRTNRAARGYANTWRERALGLVGQGASVDSAETAAHKALGYRLSIGADLEAANAFYTERRTVIDEAVARNPDLAVQLEQVWSVAWCENTCDTCAELHGMTLPIGESFPHGEPRLHPRCGCEIDIRPTRI